MTTKIKELAEFQGGIKRLENDLKLLKHEGECNWNNTAYLLTRIEIMHTSLSQLSKMFKGNKKIKIE